MDFSIKRNILYQPLQKVVNIISNRPRLPILSHILLEINNNHLFLTTTNLEMEITVKITLNNTFQSESITIPGRKFLEICQNLPNQAKIKILSKNNKIIINSENSNFSLSTLPSSDFPKKIKWNDIDHITISKSILIKMIKLTQFSMGNQDTRYYLNGMFFETKKNTIRMVATDGYRLATCEITTDSLLLSNSIIIPRKGISEILHLLNIEKELANLKIHNNCIYLKIDNYILSSKLINAKFPNYHNVFPKKPKIFFEIEQIILKHALKRASILSNEKLRIVNLHLTTNQLKITTHNFEQDKSEEILKISYLYENIEISFNIDYLLDIINNIDSQLLKFSLENTTSGIQIEGIPKLYKATYILMPIKI